VFYRPKRTSWRTVPCQGRAVRIQRPQRNRNNTHRTPVGRSVYTCRRDQQTFPHRAQDGSLSGGTRTRLGGAQNSKLHQLALAAGGAVRSGSFCDGQCARTRPSLCGEICRRLEDPTESASAAYRRAGTRTRRETSPCAPQCKPVEVGRRDRLPRRARLRRLLRALRRVRQCTADGARRRASSRRTYSDRGLALKARSETLAGEFASMTAVPTISGCCGGRPRLPQHL